MSRPDQAGVALLDVNLLIALAWPSHVHHAAAQDWFAQRQQAGWATSAVTECGFVRVSSNAAVIPYAVSPAAALGLLDRMVALDGHEFWADDVAGVVGRQLDGTLVVGHRQVTDAHLLALALSRGGVLATLDRTVRGLASRGNRDAVVTLL